MPQCKMSRTKRSASALAAVVLARVVEPLIRSEFYQHGLIYAMMMPSAESEDSTSVACPFPVVFMSIILSPGCRISVSPVLPMNLIDPARQITRR